MQDATTNPDRLHQAKAIRPATTAIQPAGGICPADDTTQGCHGNSQGHPKAAAPIHVANGYLKCRFFPRLPQPSKTRQTAEQSAAESDCFRSLAQLGECLGIGQPQRINLPFPQNVALAVWDLQAKAKQVGAQWDSLELIQENDHYYFKATYHEEVDRALHYIPIAPLHQLLNVPQRRPAAELLLSVFAYLYTHAGIPYHGDPDTYIGQQYQSMPEWLDGEDQTPETKQHRKAVSVAKRTAKAMKKIITCPTHLSEFSRRLETFSPRDAWECDCLTIARTAHSLYRDFPGRRFNRHAQDFPQEEDLSLIDMEWYISFVHDLQGWTWKTLKDWVNTDFQEYGDMQLPTIVHHADGTALSPDTLAFEVRLFPIFGQLIDLFENLKNRNHEPIKAGN